ncbi:MAG TPA: MOFRL family protein, partial [Caulobacteraceae bacterium]|nr:MOFRL family protein [Caulobacteraceae bacterium]
TLAEARTILDRYGIESAAARRVLADRANAPPAVPRGEVRLLAKARDALAAAGAAARGLGYTVVDLGDDLEGEARDLGRKHAALALDLVAGGGQTAILSGGETTVTVANPSGKGGRNLEYLLSLAIALDGAAGVAAIACDTDGIDGACEAAGAMVFPDTLQRARAANLDATALLLSNNAYRFFESLGDLVVTRPTLTNVNDFRAIVVERARLG